MWSWDQGRLDYFQFDEIRKIAKFAVSHDLKAVSVDEIRDAVGLPFLPKKDGYKPWRNYSRTFKLAMLASGKGSASEATPLAKHLAIDGRVTSDEYFHFLAQATSDPSPALSGWKHEGQHRYPLLFSLKFLLTRANLGLSSTTLDQIIAAYESSGFVGDEGQTHFLGIAEKKWKAPADVRQAKESLRVMTQISYLNSDASSIAVSLAQADALEIFNQLDPIGGTYLVDGDDEIQRRAGLFTSAIAGIDLEYSHTVVSDTEEAGFVEGDRIERTHLKIERNAQLRKAFFSANPTAVCDFCGNDTKKLYPWADRVLDIHHLLPLCSGARTSKSGTVLDDLVANCPSCHRAVHRYYATWLKSAGKKDFEDAPTARAVYEEAKANRGS